MIHSKDHNKCEGFTLVEVILTVAIIETVLTSLFVLQSNLFNIAIKGHAEIVRIFYIKNLFFDFEALEKIKKEKTFKKDLQNPSMKLIFEMKAPGEKSIVKRFENIDQLKATGTWRTMFRDQEETFINFIYNPKKKKKK